MRVIFVVTVILSAGFAGCFGTDELFEEKRGIPGGLALACLQDDKFEKMKIHFLYEEGYDPIAMDLVKTRLQQVCDKPKGIQIVANAIDFSEDNSWSSDDVRDARWKHGEMQWVQILYIGISYSRKGHIMMIQS